MDVIFFAVICFVLMAIGMAGVILPFLPGVPLAWLGLFLYAWQTGFQRISVLAISTFLALAVVAVLIDFLAPIIGAKKYKASGYGIWGVFLGAMVGIFVLGPFGVVIGAVGGALLGELAAGKGLKRASRATLGAFLGFLGGVLVKLVIILTMFGFFVFSLFSI